MPLDPLLAISDTPVDHVDAGFLEAVILARKQDQVTVMSEPSYEGRCHLLIIQNVDPPGEFQISIEYYDLARIITDLGKEVEQYIDAVPVIRDISEFIDHIDRCFTELVTEGVKLTGLHLRRQSIDQ